MSLKYSFGKQAYYTRAALGVTQEEVASAAGISVRGYQYIENGAFVPKAETMLKIMIALGMKVTLFCKEVGVNGQIQSDKKQPAYK